MEIKGKIDPKDYEVGVIMARFQVDELHEGHIDLIDSVCANHKKVIIFLGVPIVGGSKTDPLDFATRRAMIQERYPNVVILAQNDNRSDEKWFSEFDRQIPNAFGERPTVLYGSRDSFIPHYKGKHPVIEYIPQINQSGTQLRKRASIEVLPTRDFRAGVIHAVFAQRPVTYPTVDVVAYNDKGEILLGKKPNEKQFRFIGGFVDRTDTCWEHSARREFAEETGGCEIGDLKYVASGAIKDWRYEGSESGIMTTLFIGKFMWGKVQATDDIEALKWVNPFEVDVETEIMTEHRELFQKLLEYLGKLKK